GATAQTVRKRVPSPYEGEGQGEVSDTAPRSSLPLRLRSRRQPTLRQQIDRSFDWDPDDSCITIDPSIAVEQCIFLRTQIGEVSTRGGLHPRRGRLFPSIRRSQRIPPRAHVRLASCIDREQEPHRPKYHRQDHEPGKPRNDDGAKDHVTRLVPVCV